MSFFGGGTKKKIAEFKAQRPLGRAAGAPGLNCLVLGGGGREYALAWALARASSVATIDALPGNGGTALFARSIDVALSDASALQRYLAASLIDLAIVGPDELVAQGLGDLLRRAGIAVVAPSRDAARIEWSKTYAKELMVEAGVPTAPWASYADADAARAALAGRDGPVVVKADGLAAGKGVVVARDRAEALEAVGTPGVGGGRIVLEDVLEGEEASLQALVDGDTVVALPTAKDHKRVGDGDTGPNTGGMGAVSPSPALPDGEAQDAADEFIAPVARALGRRGTPYRGVIFAGMIRTRDGWRVLEYNARFGDPEAQVTLPRLEGDFGKLMLALGEGRLAAHVAEDPLRVSARAAVSVALCTEGYPGASRKGDVIEIAPEGMPEGVYLMHAGTRQAGAQLVTTGGRAVHVVGTGDTVEQARARAYEGAARVSFDGKFYRSDIGKPAEEPRTGGAGTGGSG
ncbi:MAG TPA: phosphoribosylamine--glycine ligase [Candidatus Limnocylindria bacterium]|nr:phosphoribosylamine--glycine ligase [Candidatus Limnocylindria bacterium]